MKTLLGLLIVDLLVALGSARNFSRGCQRGEPYDVSNAHVASYDFQVWRRKNPGWTEPYTTWLLFAKKVAKWMLRMLEFEDTYRPLLPSEKKLQSTLSFPRLHETRTL